MAAAAGAPLVAAAEGMLAARSAPEKMFGLLEMVEGVGAALPPLRAALSAAGHSRLARGSVGAQREAPPAVAQLVQLRSHLAAAARACWGQLPDYLSQQAARGVPPDANLHPLVATTMALLKRTLAFQSALPVLFGDGAGAGGAGRGGLAEQARLQERTAVAVAGVLDALLSGARWDTKGRLLQLGTRRRWCTSMLLLLLLLLLLKSLVWVPTLPLQSQPWMHGRGRSTSSAARRRCTG